MREGESFSLVCNFNGNSQKGRVSIGLSIVVALKFLCPLGHFIAAVTFSMQRYELFSKARLIYVVKELMKMSYPRINSINVVIGIFSYEI